MTAPAEHRGAGADEHRALLNMGSEPEEVEEAWFARVKELLADQADGVFRHDDLTGQMFSPATCEVCRALADAELQALADVHAARAAGVRSGPTASGGAA